MNILTALFGTRLTESERLIHELEAEALRLDLVERQANRKLLEAELSSLDNIVDTSEIYFEGGERWSSIGPGRHGKAVGDNRPYESEGELDEIRCMARKAAQYNEFARSGHGNRINYIVGYGHAYDVKPKKEALAELGDDPANELAELVKGVIDAFVHENCWGDRQQEIVLRCDRDGEVFLRFFDGAAEEGFTRVRFVDPECVRAPVDKLGAAPFGVETDAEDVETPVAYWIDGERVEAAEIQHRKWNVDSNWRRGLPTFFGDLPRLWGACKLLRNMERTIEVQSAIALIREHSTGTAQSVSSFADAVAARKTTNTSTGEVRRQQRIRPGTILDAAPGVKYNFPAQGMDASKGVGVLQACLRAVAAAHQMPEYMFTADASNGNYASTMVAEGPAVKNFERLQARVKAADLKVLWRVVQRAIQIGKLPENAWDMVEIQVTCPTLVTRDALQDAQANQIANQAKVLSARTWAGRLGLDYEAEQANIEEEGANDVGPLDPLAMPGDSGDPVIDPLAPDPQPGAALAKKPAAPPTRTQEAMPAGGDGSTTFTVVVPINLPAPIVNSTVHSPVTVEGNTFNVEAPQVAAQFNPTFNVSPADVTIQNNVPQALPPVVENRIEVQPALPAPTPAVDKRIEATLPSGQKITGTIKAE